MLTQDLFMEYQQMKNRMEKDDIGVNTKIEQYEMFQSLLKSCDIYSIYSSENR